MAEKTTVAGIMLTLIEVREVVDFWDAHCTGKVPTCLFRDVEGYEEQEWELVEGDCHHVKLSEELVEQLRDIVEPWKLVDHRESKNGDLVQCRLDLDDWKVYRALVVPPDWTEGKTLYLIEDLDTGEVVSMPTEIRLRRPLRILLTPGGVKPGQVFHFLRRPKVRFRRTRQGWLNMNTWDHMRFDDELMFAEVQIEEENDG